MALSAKYPAIFLGFVGGKKELPISSMFGPRWGRPHNGIDIAVPAGTVVAAAYDGKVIVSKTEQYKDRTKPAYGLYLVLEHENYDSTKFYTLYAHLTSASVEVGDGVKAGQQIALSGGAASDYPNCGSSTGPHLHFEVHVGKSFGTRVDPASGWLCRHVLSWTKKNGGNIISRALSTITWFSSDSVKTYSQAKAGKTSVTVPVDESAVEPRIVSSTKNNIAADKLAPGIWQITKLLMDSSIEDRQVVDSSIAVQTGSLLNFFQKVCQEPFVEFMGDTYGSQYYYIIRRPPTDREGMLRMIKDTMTNISEDEVFNTNLDWNREGIYSWYQYLPQGDVLGTPELQYMIPAVLFPEYAQLWGSKPMSIRSNYYNLEQAGFFNSDNSKELADNCDRVMRIMMSDFRYLIESNAYNPFVRRGTISIRGNRKIKRGTAVRLAATDEVFHVDSVSNSFNITGNNVSRATVLNVSRGMFLPYVNGVKEGGKTYSYFDIIDFGKTKIEQVTQDNFKEVLSQWRVNYDVFTFFLQKQVAVMNQGDHASARLGLGYEEFV